MGVVIGLSAVLVVMGVVAVGVGLLLELPGWDTRLRATSSRSVTGAWIATILLWMILPTFVMHSAASGTNFTSVAAIVLFVAPGVAGALTYHRRRLRQQARDVGHTPVTQSIADVVRSDIANVQSATGEKSGPPDSIRFAFGVLALTTAVWVWPHLGQRDAIGVVGALAIPVLLIGWIVAAVRRYFRIKRMGGANARERFALRWCLAVCIGWAGAAYSLGAGRMDLAKVFWGLPALASVLLAVDGVRERTRTLVLAGVAVALLLAIAWSTTSTLPIELRRTITLIAYLVAFATAANVTLWRLPIVAGRQSPIHQRVAGGVPAPATVLPTAVIVAAAPSSSHRVELQLPAVTTHELPANDRVAHEPGPPGT